MQKIKTELAAACESNGESLDDINSLFGVTMDGCVADIDLSYIDGEEFTRFSKHVAYSDDFVYISARNGGLDVSYTFASAPKESADLVERFS